MKKLCFIGVTIVILIFSFCKTKNKENNRDFTNGSKITIEQYDTLTIENLTLLCKIWGFLKYYHPAVAEGKFNWDIELFQIMPSILQSKSVSERNSIFEEWINSLGKVENSKGDTIIPADSVKMYPDISWIEDRSTLDNNVVNQLVEIKNSKRGNDHYYIDFVPDVNNPIFKNENEHISFSHPDTGYYLLALFRYWNIIQYYFPYKYLIGENWNDILPEFIPQFIDAKNELEYKLLLLKLISKIHDTHAQIYGDTTLEKYKGINIAPYEITFIENKAIVTELLKHGSTDLLSIKKGDILLSINDESIDDIIQRKLPFTSASNYPTQLRDIVLNLLRTNNNKLLIQYERKNETFKDSIICYPLSDVNIPSKSQQNKPCYQLLLMDKSISYIYPGSTIGGRIPDSISTKGIIIDLRCYPSSVKVKGYWEFDQLYAQSLEFAKFTKGSFKAPGTFTFTPSHTVGKSNKNHYRGKIIVLINELTQSHAEFVAMKYQCIPNSIFIGSTTAGADGNVSKFTLPGGINTAITGLGVYYPDGRETQRIGIVPDIEVKSTIKGIQQGGDEVLEKAIEIISSKR
ncbi:S41 family peptidase [Dysgonomonas sp. GY617]|uniref:S41 family peptidase n=1 Tax=Dysgonomonas sp. GY617 TaxID=2780420 RepID=UPI0018842133|nr:S41 family peptidase [Dysgonomonas sp. GY617]MBF0576028.1 peptidase S41 [Dysgonomonas sp. GY617]